MSRHRSHAFVACCLAAVAAVANAQSRPAVGTGAITAEGSTLTVAAGTYVVAGKEIAVAEKAVFAIAPADVVAIEDEPLKLSPQKPAAWHTGTPLAGPHAKINALGSFVPGSLVIRKTPDGPPLAEGKDYLVSNEHGMLGIGPSPSVTTSETVYASYRYSLLRIDSIVVNASGRAILLRGKPDISVPLPPEPDEGQTRLANVFRPYRATTVRDNDVFPAAEPSAAAVTRTTRGRLPHALAKLKAGRPLTIVCLGNSVTTGGDASKASMKYVEQFRRMLIDRHGVSAPINIVNLSVGGTNSQQWLRLGPYTDEFCRKTWGDGADQIQFDRVVALKPDVLTIEFVNDAGLAGEALEKVYSQILERLKPFGTEVVLITPHFTAAAWMGVKTLREPDPRPYVKWLYEFADKHKLAVADASSRWAHLWKEGLPYPTLLVNTVNHPDDRGHRIFAEELVKCFE